MLIRFINTFALALLVGNMTHPQGRFFASQAASPFVICGRNSLYIFCLGVLLAVFGRLVLNEVSGRVAMQFAVSAAGIATMFGFAALLEWFAAARAASGRKFLGGQ